MTNPAPTPSAAHSAASTAERGWRSLPDGTLDYGGHQVDSAALARWITERIHPNALEVFLFSRGFPSELAAEAAGAYTPTVAVPGAGDQPLVELARRVDDLVDLYDTAAVAGTYGGALIAARIDAVRHARSATAPAPAPPRLRAITTAARQPSPDYLDHEAVAELVGRVVSLLEEWDHSDAPAAHAESPLADEVHELRELAAHFTDLAPR